MDPSTQFAPYDRDGECPVGIVVDKSTRVLIENVPAHRLEAEGFEALKAEFSEFGPIDRYTLFTDRAGRFTGRGLCTYRNPADAKLAIRKMNEWTDTDGSSVKVSHSGEHGVVLADQVHRYNMRRVENKDDKWSHDKFEELQSVQSGEGGRGFRGRGGRGRGRGRGGPFVDRIEQSFNRYVSHRDAVLSGSAPDPTGGAFAFQSAFGTPQAQPQATTVKVEEEEKFDGNAMIID